MLNHISYPLSIVKAEVLKAAMEARKGLETTLKHDPTLNLEAPPAGFNPNTVYVNPVGNRFFIAMQCCRTSPIFTESRLEQI